MRPSSLGGGRIMRRTLSVRLSVRPSRYRRSRLFGPASVTDVLFGMHWGHPYFSARTEGRISYGHLGRTDSCFHYYYLRSFNACTAKHEKRFGFGLALWPGGGVKSGHLSCSFQSLSTFSGWWRRAQTLYALRVLRCHGLSDAALQNIYRATVIARLTYLGVLSLKKHI